MDKTQLKILLDKHLDGTITKQEMAMLDTWYLNAAQKEHPELNGDFINESVDRVWDRLQASGPKQIRLWPRMAAIAAVLALIAGGIYLFSYPDQAGSTNAVAYTKDIAPGNVGATLTLANGKQISLADAGNGEIAKQAGITVTKTADGQLVYKAAKAAGETDQMNTLKTAKGETYVLTLPDHSKVWLNAASSLTYRASLKEAGKRYVKLEGEAYFEIAKDKAHPFIVKTGHQEVEVLGTHFNVNAYADEPETKTTLLEGSVKVSQQTIAATYKTLKPGEQSVLTATDIKVGPIDTEGALAWKNGDFIFKDEPVENVMRQLARWYNIEVVYRGELPKDGFTGEISRSKSLSKVLELLQQTKGVHFKIEERRIIVSQ